MQQRKKLISARHRKVCLTFALKKKIIKKRTQWQLGWIGLAIIFTRTITLHWLYCMRQPVAQLTKFLCYTFLVVFDRSRYLLKMCTSFYKFQMMMGMKLTSLKEYPRDGGKHWYLDQSAVTTILYWRSWHTISSFLMIWIGYSYIFSMLIEPILLSSLEKQNNKLRFDVEFRKASCTW